MTKFLAIAFFAFLFVSCKKEAGSGGKATINVNVVNGINNVGGATLKLKYGAETFPGANATYDETKTCDWTGDESFTNLQRGHYYIYATSSDTLGNVLEGGAHVYLNNKPGERHTVIDFSEADPF